MALGSSTRVSDEPPMAFRSICKKKASKVMTFGQEKSLKIDDFWRRIKTSFIVWKAAVIQSLSEAAVSAEAAFIW